MRHGRRSNPVGWIGVGCFTLSLLSALSGQAEVYVGGQVGVALPLAFQSVEGTGQASGTDSGSIGLKNSLLYGGKVGYFFPSILDWLGIEADVTHKNPNMKQHTFVLTRPDGSMTSVAEGLHMSITTLALRAVIRSPDREGWGGFQPYIGVGPAFFFARTSTGSYSSADTGLGFSFQAGSRYFVSRELAVFAEYKFEAAMLKFQNAVAPGVGFNGDYNTHNLAIGVSYHFPKF